jgi:hypothetical protein
MIGVLQDLLGGGKRAPARQIFHSIVSNQARKSLLLTCLQRSKINAKKTDIYETIIQQFSNLNAKRNTFLHGFGTRTKADEFSCRKALSTISITSTRAR